MGQVSCTLTFIFLNLKSKKDLKSSLISDRMMVLIRVKNLTSNPSLDKSFQNISLESHLNKSLKYFNHIRKVTSLTEQIEALTVQGRIRQT